MTPSPGRAPDTIHPSSCYASAVRWVVTALALSIVACGANEAEGGHARGETPLEPPPPPPEQEDPEPATPDEDDPAEPSEPAQPPPPPEPEPVDIEAGTRLGPIQIGMSEEDVRALGLEEAEVDPRTTAFGPYHVGFHNGEIRRVEALIGELRRIRFGDHVIDAGTHIFEIRDTFGDCVWIEGGGERYRCANGTLYVHTTHTLDPQQYTVGVTVR